jgi:predicted TIM-barrel fold metal-dependent hydrolase
VQNAISVDSHFHVFKAGQALPGARYTPAYDASLAAWQAAAMPQGNRNGFTHGSAHHITHGVLVQTSFMGTDNTLLLAQLAQHPATLRGVAVVSPAANLAGLAPLHSQGVRSIRLNLAGQLHDMSAWSAATALWDAVAQLGWHVELHTDTGALPGVLAALPQALPVVVDHFGKPATSSPRDATVAALRRRSQAGKAGSATPRLRLGEPMPQVVPVPPVHVKLSAAYRLDAGLNAQPLARLWLGELGPHALLWGSDWPCTNHESQADYPALHAALGDWLGSDGDAVKAARSSNPMRLYWGE